MENKPQPTLPPERQHRHFPIFWPLLLIAVGIFLFLNSAHMLPGNTLDTLLKLWPLLLVIAGLDGFINHGGFVWSVLLAGLGRMPVRFAGGEPIQENPYGQFKRQK